ncbi:MAG: hypothetical protein IJW00_01000 [Clostridia bacterium]|nr:hypothetical protein [Clostridia bacterium]
MSYLNTDVPELKGFDTGTVLGNIQLLESRLEGLLEAVLGELSELADAIVMDASGDHDTIFSILLSLRGQPTEEGTSLKSRRLLPRNIPILTGMTRHLGLYERLLLYRLILDRVPTLPVFGTRDLYALPTTAEGRVAYMPGALADKAYIQFAEHISHCRAAGFHSFVDACEEVWNGLCEYCILPLESSAEGKLVSFSRLTVKYRLQIVAVCDIHGPGGKEDTTRFALMRSAGEWWTAEPSPVSDEKHPPEQMELLHASANPSYSEVMAAAEFCGLTLARSDTLPRGTAYALWSEEDWQQENEDIPPLIITVWHTAKADLSAFLCYLFLEASDDPILGLYPFI